MEGGALCIAAELGNLARVRRFVEKTATALGVAPETVPDLVLATDEAVTNIVVHGYRGRPGKVEIEVERDGDRVVIRLRDRAPPYDPRTVQPPDLTLPLAQRPPGGLGIYLIRQVMDQVIYDTPPQGGNELTLVKTGIGGRT